MSSSGASRDPEGEAAPDTPRTADDKPFGERAQVANPELERPTLTDNESSKPDKALPLQSPTSGERPSRKERTERRSAGEDTLLSAPAPAASFEVEVDDRLTTLERDTDDIKQRLLSLESRLQGAKRPALGAQNWLVWVVFLLALALVYQLLFRGR